MPPGNESAADDRAITWPTNTAGISKPPPAYRNRQCATSAETNRAGGGGFLSLHPIVAYHESAFLSLKQPYQQMSHFMIGDDEFFIHAHPSLRKTNLNRPCPSAKNPFPMLRK